MNARKTKDYLDRILGSTIMICKNYRYFLETSIFLLFLTKSILIGDSKLDFFVCRFEKTVNKRWVSKLFRVVKGCPGRRLAGWLSTLSPRSAIEARGSLRTRYKYTIRMQLTFARSRSMIPKSIPSVRVAAIMSHIIMAICSNFLGICDNWKL